MDGPLMDELLSALRTRVLRHADGPLTETVVPRVVVGMRPDDSPVTTTFYEPTFCLVLQGAKRVIIGDEALRYDAANYFLASIDLPATSRIVEATPEKPYLVLALRIDPEMLAGLLHDAPAVAERPAQAFGVSPVTVEILEVLLRIAKLFDAPDEATALAPLAEQELLYRLLRGPQGAVLRQFARADSRLSRVRAAIAEIRSRFDQPLRVEELARRAGMSAASFHRHFKAATAMSPLQYQKMLRLQEARNLLIANEEAARAAYAVGYESVSQFSREYSRQFGAPPARDAVRLRSLGQAAV